MVNKDGGSLSSSKNNLAGSAAQSALNIIQQPETYLFKLHGTKLQNKTPAEEKLKSTQKAINRSASSLKS